jgi:Histidine kinase-, DNA gyrase B-, and HSP90-like ATPase
MQDLSLHVLDVVENGIIAGADLIEISIDEDAKSDTMTIVIKDNGRGMEPQLLAKALDPFVTTRTTRKVGLGLSLFQQAARAAEGDLNVESAPGVGTTVSVTMQYGHIDRKPMGNMAETIVTLIEGNPEVDFVYSHRINAEEYLLDTREIRTELEGIAVNHPEVVSLIRANLISGLAEIAAD